MTCGHNAQRRHLNFSQVRGGDAGVVFFPLAHENAEIDVGRGAGGPSVGDGGVVGHAVHCNPVGVEALAEQGDVQSDADMGAVAQWRQVVRVAQLDHGVAFLADFILVQLNAKRPRHKVHLRVKVQHGGHGCAVDAHPLVAVPRVDVGQVGFSGRADVEGGGVVEPLGQLRILLGRGLHGEEQGKTHDDCKVANHVIPLIFSRLYYHTAVRKFANIGIFPMPVRLGRGLGWSQRRCLGCLHASFW